MSVRWCCIVIMACAIQVSALSIDEPLLLWHNSYNGHDSGDRITDYGMCVAPIPEMNGFYVGGVKGFLGPNGHHDYDACLYKLSNKGVTRWYRTIGDKENGLSGSESAGAICVTTDGGAVMVVTIQDSTFCILSRYDPNGTQIWEVTIPVGNRYSIGCIRQLSDGGFIMTGGVDGTSWGNRSVWIVKFNQSGVKLWEKKYTSGLCKAVGIVPCHSPDSLIIIADADTTCVNQATRSVSNLNHAWLLKIGPGGDTAWTKRYFGLNPIAVSGVSDAGFVVSGCSNSDTLYRMTAQITRFSYSCDSLWTRTVNIMDQNTGVGAAVLGNGDFILAGNSQNDSYTRRTWLKWFSPNGDSLWFSESGNRFKTAYGIYGLQNESYVVVGGGIPDGYISGYSDIWVLNATGRSAISFEAFLGGRSDDAGYYATEVNDGYLIIGNSGVYERQSGICFRTSSTGVVRWKKAFPEVYHFLKNDGNQWLFAGVDTNGYFLSCTDTLANMLWKKTVHPDTAASIIKTCLVRQNGGYYLLGKSKLSTDILIKLDEKGDNVWVKTEPNWSIGPIIQRKNGDLVTITGSAFIGMDSTGKTLWTRQVSVPDTFTGFLSEKQVVETEDGRLTAFFGIGAGSNHLYIVRTDSLGNELWHKVYQNKFSWHKKTCVINGNQYLISGSTARNLDSYLACLDSNANIIWERYHNESDSTREGYNNIQVLKSGNILVIGELQNSQWLDWDISVSEWGKGIPLSVPQVKQQLHSRLILSRRSNGLLIDVPEKNGAQTRIVVDLFTIDGRIVQHKISDHNVLMIPLETNGNSIYSSGMLLVRIRSGRQEWKCTIPLIR